MRSSKENFGHQWPHISKSPPKKGHLISYRKLFTEGRASQHAYDRENKKPIRSTEGNRNKLRRIDKQVVGIFTKKTNMPDHIVYHILLFPSSRDGAQPSEFS